MAVLKRTSTCWCLKDVRLPNFLTGETMNKLNYDKLIDTYYEKEFYIEEEFDKDWDGHRMICLYFKDIKNMNVQYFAVIGRWHPKKREIDYDIEQFNKELKWARQQMRQNRMKRKMYRIKKDFE